MSIEKGIQDRGGSFFRLGGLSLALVMAGGLLTGCGDEAESREDLDGRSLTEEAAAERGEAVAPATQPAEAIRALSAGTTLSFVVTEEVSTSTSRSGDPVRLELAESVSGSGGLDLPAGTRAQGIVTNSRASEGPEDEAVLAIRVEAIHLNGRTRALNGSVIEARTESSARDSGTRSAAKVATGAAAGALVGQILGGDTRSTVGGAAAGTVAGLGVALSTRDGHAVLPEGSLVRVRLNDDLVMQ
jgi:hypothetical protein